MNKYTRVIGIVFVFLTMAFIVGCSNTEDVMQDEERELPVEVDRVSYGMLSGSNELMGTIIPYEEVDITPKTNGEIVEIFVKKGDIVQAGDVIAQLDDFAERNALDQERTRLKQAEGGLEKAQMGRRNAEQSYAQSEASLAQAESSLAEAREKRSQSLDDIEFQIQTAQVAWEEAHKGLERASALYEDGLISEQDYEKAVNGEKQAKISLDQVKANKTYAGSETGLRSLEASVDQARFSVQMARDAIREAELGMRDAEIAVEQAQLAVDAAEDRLDDKKIIATAAGEVVELNGHVGEMASPQAVFAEVLEIDRVKLSAHLTVDQLDLFEIGEQVNVSVARMDEHVSGLVSYISSTSEEGGLFTIEVEINNADKKLRPGMFASIIVEETLADEGIIIPTRSLVEKQGETYVFIVEDGRAVQKMVEVKKMDTEYTAVTGDLKEDDQVIVKGQNLLEDEDPVLLMGEDKE